MNTKPLLFGVLVLGQACITEPFRGTSTGNAMRMGLESTAGMANDTLLTQSEAGVDFTIESATAQVDRISFELSTLVKCDQLGLSSPMSCDSANENIEITGDYTVDVVRAEFDPSIDDLTLPNMKFETLDVTLNTLDIMGSFTYDEDVLTYSMSLAFSEIVAFNAEEGFKLEDNQTLWMSMNTDTWLNDVGVTACLDAGDVRAVDGHVELTNTCDNAVDSVSQAVEASMVLKVD